MNKVFEKIVEKLEEECGEWVEWLQSEVEVQSMKWLIRKILKQVVKLYFFVDKECYCFHIGTKHPNYDYTVIKNRYPD